MVQLAELVSASCSFILQELGKTLRPTVRRQDRMALRAIFCWSHDAMNAEWVINQLREFVARVDGYYSIIDDDIPEEMQKADVFNDLCRLEPIIRQIANAVIP